MEYYSAMKRNGMGLENNTLSERNQTQKAIHYLMSLYKKCGIGKSARIERRLVEAKGWRKKEMGCDC
jgi:argininosuccinate synthase